MIWEFIRTVILEIITSYCHLWAITHLSDPIETKHVSSCSLCRPIVRDTAVWKMPKILTFQRKMNNIFNGVFHRLFSCIFSQYLHLVNLWVSVKILWIPKYFTILVQMVCKFMQESVLSTIHYSSVTNTSITQSGSRNNTLWFRWLAPQQELWLVEDNIWRILLHVKIVYPIYSANTHA